MAREIQPLAQLNRRIPEQGRIRIGKKVGEKGRPSKISTFRFTSQDRTAIEQIAAMYGGTAEPWSDDRHPNQWQVETLVTEIDVVLPPGCLGDGPVYELWNKGGLLRRCDGVTCQVPKSAGDDHWMEPTPCICRADGTEDCKVKLRLQVLLRGEVRFAGAWLLTTSSWNAAQELPGMVDMILAMQSGNLPLGILRLEQRVSNRGGKTYHFNIPVLAVDASLTEIAAGGNQLTAAKAPALGGDRPALSAVPDPDDTPAEGVVIWDPVPTEGLAEQVATRWNRAHPVATTTGTQLLGILAKQVAGTESQSFYDLTSAQNDKVCDLLEDVLAGDVEITSIENGRIKVKRG